jgi:glycosyltransferase involved in cell wall biosynthesis
MPSIWEDNGPLVLLEAQARARALIVTDRGGPKEFVPDGVAGFVVDPEDPQALAAAMSRVALDPQLAARLGRAGRNRVLEHNGAQEHHARLVHEYEAAIEALR